MGRTVTIITTVAVSGTDICLAAGDPWDVSEEVAAARIAAGLARPVDDAEARLRVERDGRATETAAVTPAESRAASRRPARRQKEA